MLRRKRILLFSAFAAFVLLVLLIAVLVALGYLALPKETRADGPPPAGCGLLRIYFINASQADSVLIITPGNRTMLVDAGSGMKKGSAENVAAFLEKMDVRKLDYVVATHYHEDHIGGMKDVFENFDVGTVYDNGNCGNYSSAVQKEFQEYAKHHSYSKVERDMEIAVDPCITTQLIAAYDRAEGCWKSDENENSILVRVSYGNHSVLLSGDCGEGCERELLGQRTDLHADVLKVGHHGSSSSSSAAFLSAVGADYYVLEVSANRSVSDGYFHPRKEALSSIYAAGGSNGNLFRTDLNGDVGVIVDRYGVGVAGARGADACGLWSGFSSSDALSYGPIPELAGQCG